jgi:fructose-1-phosphate kinase PfkB-like protein
VICAPSDHLVRGSGSGDAFLSGLVVAVAEGQRLQEALRLAAACGAANALIPGQGQIETKAVTRLLARCEVTRLR